MLLGGFKAVRVRLFYARFVSGSELSDRVGKTTPVFQFAKQVSLEEYIRGLPVLRGLNFQRKLVERSQSRHRRRRGSSSCVGGGREIMKKGPDLAEIMARWCPMMDEDTARNE